VTFVGGFDPTVPEAGGTRTYVLGLAARLRDRGVGVTLVARDGSGRPPEGIEYFRVASGPTSVRFFLRLLTAAPRLAIPQDSILHVQRPDHLVPFVAAKRRLAAVCTLHGIPARGIRRRRGVGYASLYAGLEGIGLRRSDRVIAVDATTLRWYEDRYPWLAGRTTVVPVAVDTDRFRPMDRDAARQRFGVSAKYAVVYAGRLTVEKRVDAIVSAVSELPDAELLVAGSGPEEPRLRQLARGAPVRFLGTIPHEEMPPLLNAADALLLPSEYEGLPTVALEGLACGVPIVATPVGAIPELVVPGRTGWLLSDVSALSLTLAEALPSARGLREACVAAARPYAWDHVVERVLAVYRAAEEAA